VRRSAPLLYILKSGIILEDRQYLLGEELEAFFQLRIGQSTEGESPDDVLERHSLVDVDVTQLLEDLRGGSGCMQALEKLDRLGFGFGVNREVGVGLLELGVKLVALDPAQMAVGEVIVAVDRIA
jgi:hypothetical protein